MMDGYEKALALWRDKKIITDADLEAALSAHRISFAYHSCKIENELVTYFDTQEIFERDAVSSYSGDLTTLLEIRNAKEASVFFVDAFGEGRRLDEKFIKRLHRLLTRNTYDDRRYRRGERPGEYKRHDYVVGVNETGAFPEDVAREMSELLEELRDIPDADALTAAAYFHARFEEIHPFADGNGRTGRLAMNYFLVTHNHPPIIIFQEDRPAYYAALEAWSGGEQLEPLRAFLREQTAKSWAKQIARWEARMDSGNRAKTTRLNSVLKPSDDKN